jgi:NAD(P)-dependent dehydrogenase (short-subunit alcohol dehydrogenase family)
VSVEVEDMSGRLAGKSALISGAASGLGAAQARRFAAEGASVILGDLQTELGEAVAAEIRSRGGRARFVRLDVTEPASWDAAVAEAKEHHGGLTTLVNNAGIFHPGGLEAESLDGWSRMIAVNQTGVFNGMKAAMAALVASGNGAIVNISSLFGIIGSANAISYHASKGAVRIMGKAAALELVKKGVRVNTIFPGQIQTPILGDITPEQDAAIKAAIPMGRVGQPEEIAAACLFLASDEARYITGAELVIDGGWSAGT